jgi:hypothetical protein
MSIFGIFIQCLVAGVQKLCLLMSLDNVHFCRPFSMYTSDVNFRNFYTWLGCRCSKMVAPSISTKDISNDTSKDTSNDASHHNLNDTSEQNPMIHQTQIK